MLLDLIELPNRYLEYDQTLSTTLPCFRNAGSLEEVDWYGRSIPLSIFTSGKVKKYKTLEQSGPVTMERIFFTVDEIDINKKWWTSRQKVYPIQMKMFSYTNPIIGRTFKYVNGITEFIEQEVDDGSTVVPAALDRYPIKDPELMMNSAYNVIIPSLDSEIYRAEFTFNPVISTEGIDNWVDRDNDLASITKFISRDMNSRPGLACFNMIERPFDDSDYSVNTDPINNCWAVYDLLMFLNDLAVSDIRIEMLADRTCSISFSSRYSGLFDYSHFGDYETVKSTIRHLTEKMMADSYHNDPWVKIVIEKLWTEEIYITAYMQCEGRSSLIDVRSYVDLPVFLLGTVGLK